MGDAGVVDEDVDPAHLGHRAGDHLGHAVAIRDVDPLRDTVTGRRHAFCALDIDVGHQHLRALGGEAHGDTLAKARSGAGHDGAFALKSHVLSPP